MIAGAMLAMAALLVHAGPARAAENHIAAELVPDGAVAPGGTIDLAIAMKPEAGWHGYWSNPGDAGYGMQLKWSLPSGWQAGDPRYPVPQTLLISGLMNHVYEGPYAVIVPLSIPRGGPARARIPVTLEAQWLACTDTICVPERATLAAVVAVAPSASPDPRFDNWRAKLAPPLDRPGVYELRDGKLLIAIPLPKSFAIAAPHLFLANEGLIDYAAPQNFRRSGDSLIVELRRKGDGQVPPSGLSGILKLDSAGAGIAFTASAGSVPGGGEALRQGDVAPATAPLWVLILGALAGGILLNIMPCVFPILSLKALSLARAGESQADARSEGLAYSAGVVLACLALGALMLVLRAAGNEIGWAFQLQEPGVVLALLLVAAAITANLVGLFELPGLSLSRSGRPMGAFATGLLAAFVATPCTGPFMAAAMGAALLLPPAQALLLFAALGLGIALPFLALGFLPALRRLLPRPGNWMNTFRKLMAVPMGLTALALLWLAWRLGGIAFAAVAAIAVSGVLFALFLAGRRQRAGRAALGVFALAASPFVAAAAIALPLAESAQHADAEASLLSPQPFSEAALAKARASGKPVFVWFTADWCLTCKVNEGVAIEREETRKAFQRAGVVALRGDWTRRDPAITRFLTKQGAAGVPLYLWYPAGREGQKLPQILTPDSLVSLAEAN